MAKELQEFEMNVTVHDEMTVFVKAASLEAVLAGDYEELDRKWWGGDTEVHSVTDPLTGDEVDWKISQAPTPLGTDSEASHKATRPVKGT